MGYWKQKPKQLVEVEISEKLRESLAEVLLEISEAERNPDDANIDFDNAIQIGGLCGGRNRKAKREFSFTWHLGNETRCKWHLVFHAHEIENIAQGLTRTLALYRCESSICQCAFQASDDRCFCCDRVEDDPTVLHMRSRANAFQSKRQFVEALLQIEPEANSHRVFEIFQPIEGLGERVGWLSFAELDQLIQELRASKKE